MRNLAVSLLFCAAGTAQPVSQPVSIAFSPQPPELTRIAFGNIGNRLETWQVTICNDGKDHADVSSGKVYQAAQAQKLPVLNRSMALAAVVRARNRSLPSILSRAISIASLLAGALSGANVIPAGKNLKAVLPLVGISAEVVGASLRQGPSEEKLQRFDQEVLENTVSVPAGGCVSKIVFTARIRAPKPFAAKAK